MNKGLWFLSWGLLTLSIDDVAGQEKILPAIKVSNQTAHLSWNSKENVKYKILYKDEISFGWQELMTVHSSGLTTEASDAALAKERYYAVLPTERIQWGATAGSQESDMIAFEGQIGIQADHFAVFVHWGNENAFPSYLKPYMKNRGKTLIIFWEATDYNVASTEQSRFNYDSVLRGEWDTYFKSFVQNAKVYGGPVILIPYSEMNGNWTPWAGTSNGNTPAKHIAAYRYIREFARGATNMSFGWAVNNGSVPNVKGNQIKDYYPGDAYVDIVGVDGFNFSNPWQTFDQVFDSSLTALEVYEKPVYIFSFACAAGPRKASWITDALTVQIPKHPKIKGWVWFNENKERDWRVISDTNSLNAFTSAVLER